MKPNQISIQIPAKLILFCLSLMPTVSIFAAEQANNKASVSSPAISSHALRSARLRETMGELDRLVLERMYTEPDLDRQRRRYAKDIAETALDLERATSSIPNALEEGNLTAEQQQDFLNLTEQLRAQALLLNDLASQGDFAEFRPTFDRIIGICSSCHSQFRLSPIRE